MLYGEVIRRLAKTEEGHEQIILLAAVIVEDVIEKQDQDSKVDANYFMKSLAYALIHSDKNNAEFLYDVARTMLEKLPGVVEMNSSTVKSTQIDS